METGLFEVLLGNRTRDTSQAIYMPVADCDGMIQFGMEKGINEGYEFLDGLMDKLKLA